MLSIETFNALKNLGESELIEKTLSFYECPKKCQALCCKKLTVAIEPFEVERLSKINGQCKKVFTEGLAILEGKIHEADTETVKDLCIKAKPCPLLRFNKCSIHKQKPFLCAMYPFRLLEGEGEKLDIELVVCELGLNILCDLLLFKVYIGNLDSKETASKIFNEGFDFIKPLMLENLLNVESLPTVGISNKKELAGLVCYLKAIPKDDLKYFRNNLKLALLGEAHKEKAEEIKAGEV